MGLGKTLTMISLTLKSKQKDLTRIKGKIHSLTNKYEILNFSWLNYQEFSHSAL